MLRCATWANGIKNGIARRKADNPVFIIVTGLNLRISRHRQAINCIRTWIGATGLPLSATENCPRPRADANRLQPRSPCTIAQAPQPVPAI